MTGLRRSASERLRQLGRACAALADELSDPLQPDAAAAVRHPAGLRLVIKSGAPEPQRPSAPIADQLCDDRLAGIAMRLLHLRRKREALFGSSLFADPAWDMLLDLFVQRQQGRSVSVSSLCIAGSVPPTTALRYVTALEASGWIFSARSPVDGRKRYLDLTTAARNNLRTLLDWLEASASG